MNQLNSEDKSPEKCNENIGRFQRILPQVPALTGILNEHNQNEYLSITAEQATWIGSIPNLAQLIGCLLSILITDPLGRKQSMILSNIPFALGWVMIYQGDAFWKILTGVALLGLGVGLGEFSVTVFHGEVCEPSVRGILFGVATVFATMGIFTIYLLNNLMPWRSVALFCLACPIISAIAICFIPEKPQWLLSKNRSVEAEKSLRWLRGWVPSELVRKEFHELQRLGDRSKSCVTCIKQDVKCGHPLPTMREKCAELQRKQTIKPFIIVILMFFITQFSGILPMKTYMVQIFKAYNSPLPPDQTVTVMSFSENVATLIFTCVLRFIGKRRLFLYTLSAVSICSAVISCYGFVYLPSSYVSFEQETFKLENQYLSYIPLVCMLLWSFFSFCGLLSLPFIVLVEIFPFKTRGIASAIGGSIYYLICFVSIKTYYAMETTLSLPGMSLFYCIVCVCGMILMYSILPETENRTLEDIELHFLDNSKNITDHKIAKSGENKPEDVEHAVI